MRAMLPSALGNFPGQVWALVDVHRANLRNRTYATAALNPPTVADRARDRP